ncbi:MAG: hypothetical protein MJ211_01820 [Bacteroidales bacterium]|nr:hypothetical protein [Bacteroidales bacterium]
MNINLDIDVDKLWPTISLVRLNNMVAGAIDFKLRLTDWLRMGFINISENIDNFIGPAIERLVDAQLVGFVNILSEIVDYDFSDDVYKYLLTNKFVYLYTLCDSLINIKNLSPEWQTEILVIAGVNVSKADILKFQPVNDLWMVLAVENNKIKFNNISKKTVWLVGCTSKKIACNIQFYKSDFHDEFNLNSGTYITSDFYFYRGIHSMRVLAPKWNFSNSSFAPNAFNGINIALKIFRKIVSENPFISQIPLIVSGLIFGLRNNKYCVSDVDNNVMPLQITENEVINLLCFTAGKPFSAFVFINEYFWKILSIWSDSGFYSLNYEMS